MTDMTTGETYTCTIGRPGGKSPHEMRLLADHAVAADFLHLAVRVGDDPMTT